MNPETKPNISSEIEELLFIISDIVECMEKDIECLHRRLKLSEDFIINYLDKQ